MNDDLIKMVEEQLGAFKPAPLPVALVGRIARQVEDPPLTWVDRLVGGFMATSAAAALLIAAMIAGQLLPGPQDPPRAQEEQAAIQRLENNSPLRMPMESRLAQNEPAGW